MWAFAVFASAVFLPEAPEENVAENGLLFVRWLLVDYTFFGWTPSPVTLNESRNSRAHRTWLPARSYAQNGSCPAREQKNAGAKVASSFHAWFAFALPNPAPPISTKFYPPKTPRKTASTSFPKTKKASASSSLTPTQRHPARSTRNHWARSFASRSSTTAAAASSYRY